MFLSLLYLMKSHTLVAEDWLIYITIAIAKRNSLNIRVCRNDVSCGGGLEEEEEEVGFPPQKRF